MTIENQQIQQRARGRGQSFKEAYAVLQGHATRLREQKEPNIDELLEVVTQSVEARRICQERIDAVEKALHEALSKKD